MESIQIIDHVLWEKKSSFSLSKDTDNFWVLYLITAGSCSFKIGEHSGQTQGPCLLVCPPNTLFERAVLTPMTFHFFRIDFPISSNYLHASSGLFSIDKDRLLMNEKMLKQYVYDLSSYSFFIRAHFIQDLFLFHFIDAHSERPIHSPTVSSRNSRVKELSNYITHHSHEDLSLQDLSTQFNFNPSYLSRLFKKETGFSPKEYLIHVRLKNVQQLLVSTNLPMEEIAELTGFKHGYYLSKYFKKVFSISPSEFRKKHIL